MNFEPQKFFIGVIDFFSILLPGALLTYLIMDDLGPGLLQDRYVTLTGTEGLLVFLFSSYLLGHFIFLFGSWLLDDRYDAIRIATNGRQIKRLAEGIKLSSRWNRWLAARLFKKNVDAPVEQVVRIKEYYLEPLRLSDTINAFQWCKARLTLEHPTAIATVQRFEADSKFFRSLFVVLSIFILWEVWKGQLELALFCTPMLILAFWRYVDQRLKATNQAYWYIITLEGQAETGFRQALHKEGEHLTYAGGVVYRYKHDQLEYLLVQAASDSQEWELPEGAVEFYEQPKETVIRVVREKAGVWAVATSLLQERSYAIGEKIVKEEFYLMQSLTGGERRQKRKAIWRSLKQVNEVFICAESRALLQLAEREILNRVTSNR